MFTLQMYILIFVDYVHIIPLKNPMSKDMNEFTVLLTTKLNIFVKSAQLVSAISEHLALTLKITIIEYGGTLNLKNP